MSHNENADDLMFSAIKAGSRDAFEKIYRQHWRKMYTAAFYVLKDEDQSMDIVQDVFIRLWFNRQSLNIQSLGPYLLSSIRYAVANNIRHQKVKETFFIHAQNVAVEFDYADNALMVNDLKKIIDDGVAHLPNKCRQIFELSRKEFLTNKEIAFRLGISEKTVEAQLTIAIKRLRSELGRLYLLFFF